MTQSRHRHARIVDRVLVVLFAVALVLPVTVDLLGASGVMTENRRPAPPPSVAANLDVLSEFPAAFERWFADRFGLRDVLVRLHASVLVQGLGVSPTPRVVLGRKGWLFVGDPIDLAMSGYRKLYPFPKDDLDAWAQSLEAADRWLRSRGSRLIVLVAPNAQTIYPERVPPAYNRRRGSTRLSQLARRLESTAIDFIDLRPLLWAAKSRERVYCRTDSHWNALGAFVASQAVVDHVRELFPEVPRLRRDDYQERDVVGSGGDLAGMLGLGDVLREQWKGLHPRRPARAKAADVTLAWPTVVGWARPTATETDAPTAPSAVMFRDSFGLAMAPFLSERFRRILYVSDYALDPKILESERPDVVILEIVERQLLVIDPVTRIAAAQLAAMFAESNMCTSSHRE